jgi:hypothetical protein
MFFARMHMSDNRNGLSFTGSGLVFENSVIFGAARASFLTLLCATALATAYGRLSP